MLSKKFQKDGKIFRLFETLCDSESPVDSNQSVKSFKILSPYSTARASSSVITTIDKDGNFYVGEICDDKKEGFGEITYKNGLLNMLF